MHTSKSYIYHSCITSITHSNVLSEPQGTTQPLILQVCIIQWSTIKWPSNDKKSADLFHPGVVVL